MSEKMIVVLVISWTFMSFMLIGWVIKYERDRRSQKRKNKKKEQ